MESHQKARRAPGGVQDVPYKEGTGHGKQCRVIRHSGHETIVQFIRVWFPRRDRSDQYEYYCASMLALLQPWRSMKDLKSETEHFSDVWLWFSASLTQRQINIVDNIQYYHEASDQAHKKNTSTVSGALLNVRDEHGTEEDITDENWGESHRYQEFTEEDIMAAESLHTTHSERYSLGWMPWTKPKTLPYSVSHRYTLRLQALHWQLTQRTFYIFGSGTDFWSP